MGKGKRLIIWDFDGTLADSFPVTFEAINDALELVFGERWSQRRIMTYFGKPDDVILQSMVGPKEFERAFKRMIESYKSREGKVKLYGGIAEVLETLSRRGIPQALVTGRGSVSTRVLVDQLGIGSYFPILISGNDVVNVKPDPEAAIKACRLAGVEPRDAIMIGDTPADVLGAKAAGALAVACLWDPLIDRKRIEAAGPHHELMKPAELFKLLD